MDGWWSGLRLGGVLVHIHHDLPFHERPSWIVRPRKKNLIRWRGSQPISRQKNMLHSENNESLLFKKLVKCAFTPWILLHRQYIKYGGVLGPFLLYGSWVWLQCHLGCTQLPHWSCFRVLHHLPLTQQVHRLLVLHHHLHFALGMRLCWVVLDHLTQRRKFNCVCCFAGPYFNVLDWALLKVKSEWFT